MGALAEACYLKSARRNRILTLILRKPFSHPLNVSRYLRLKLKTDRNDPVFQNLAVLI
jgi:hypothetical protein